MDTMMAAIVSFFAGGGIFKAYTVWNSRKAAKIDTADKLIKFYQDHAEKLIHRVEQIEKDVEKLKEISCTRFSCNERITTKP